MVTLIIKVFSSDPSSALWKGQPSRIPLYLEMKTQSNQDFRGVSTTASKAPPASPSSVPTPPGKENDRPSQPSSFSHPRVEDIRFQQTPLPPKIPTSGQSTHKGNPIPPSASQTTKSFPKPAFYNRGQPRSYLSDRHLRNVDVRELSSNRVSFGYQYPSPAKQSIGPIKKVPEGFTRPKPLSKAPTYSKLTHFLDYYIYKYFFKHYFPEKSRSMVPTDQIRIGFQPEAQFQVDLQTLAGSEQEPDGKLALSFAFQPYNVTFLSLYFRLNLGWATRNG